MKGIDTLTYLGNVQRVKEDHTVEDIIKQILTAHQLHAHDYDGIAGEFWRGNVKETANYLFAWVKKNIPYVKEPAGRQTSRSPGAIVALSKKVGGDCKHYALWIAGVLDGLKRSGKRINWWYRFACYDNSNVPGHVFVVVKVDGKEYWVDPVLSYPDQRNPYPTFFKDKKVTMLQHISGLTMQARSAGATPFERATVPFRTDATPKEIILSKSYYVDGSKTINQGEKPTVEIITKGQQDIPDLKINPGGVNKDVFRKTASGSNNLLMIVAGGLLIYFLFIKKGKK